MGAAAQLLVQQSSGRRERERRRVERRRRQMRRARCVKGPVLKGRWCVTRAPTQRGDHREPFCAKIKYLSQCLACIIQRRVLVTAPALSRQ